MSHGHQGFKVAGVAHKSISPHAKAVLSTLQYIYQAKDVWQSLNNRTLRYHVFDQSLYNHLIDASRLRTGQIPSKEHHKEVEQIRQLVQQMSSHVKIEWRLSLKSAVPANKDFACQVCECMAALPGSATTICTNYDRSLCLKAEQELMKLK